MSHTEGLTGHLFEEEVLGVCIVSWSGYMSFRDALQAARKSQPKKKAGVAQILEREVARHLGADVQYFTAVRTPLDFFHGVDAFMEFNGMVVTIDLTMNPSKDACKADVLVCEDEVLSLAAVRSLAGRIAREFETKQRRGRW